MKIILDDITRNYHDKKAIDNFNWKINIEKNNILGLIGPNGAGKPQF